MYAWIQAIGIWQVAHFSSIAFLKPGFRFTSELTFACQSGSLAALAITLDRQRVTGEMSDPSAPRIGPDSSIDALWHDSHRPDPANREDVSTGRSSERVTAAAIARLSMSPSDTFMAPPYPHVTDLHVGTDRLAIGVVGVFVALRGEVPYSLTFRRHDVGVGRLDGTRIALLPASYYPTGQSGSFPQSRRYVCGERGTQAYRLWCFLLEPLESRGFSGFASPFGRSSRLCICS